MSAARGPLVFYVSGHGFGHASRTVELINALLARQPDRPIVVRTAAPRWLFERTVAGPIDVHSTVCDTGIVQIDSLHLDADASVQCAREFMQDFAARAAAEADGLRQLGAVAVVADAPPLGVAAAGRAGLPGIVFSNFTWDWIYSAYAGTADLVRTIGRSYAAAAVALRLPMHGGFATIDRIVDLPFVARRSARPAADVRSALGLPLDERLVLVSFGGTQFDRLDLDALADLKGYAALVGASVPMAELPERLRGGRRGGLLPFDERAMYAAGVRYEDLVRAVDVVVSKPGYGIIAECLANDTALLYTDRGHFIEYDVLVAAMPSFLRARHIGHGDLFAGRWREHLDALLAQPAPPERPPVDGAEVAADILLSLIPDP